MRKAKAGKKSRMRIWIPFGLVATVATLLTAFFAFLIVRIRYPEPIPEDTDPSHYLLTSVTSRWLSSSGSETEGWYVAGNDGAPGILLVPGYEMSRSDVLSLAAALYEKGFHTLVYGPPGTEASRWRGARDLGGRAIEGVFSALDFLAARKGVDKKRHGIWGADIGARAALAAAVRRPEVTTLVLDSPFDRASEFIHLQILDELDYSHPFIETGCRWLLALMEWSAPSSFDAAIPLEAMQDRNILVIEGDNRPEMLPLTEALYERLQGNKQKLHLASSRVRLMRAEMLGPYDKQVTDFFMKKLGPGPAVRRGRN